MALDGDEQPNKGGQQVFSTRETRIQLQ
uniref:Uncharacterized protein n=1 Tax=Arundo donax TaxID=35708 RepID=A0A0A9EU47_ARUDO